MRGGYRICDGGLGSHHLPLLPGTLTIYSSSGSSFFWVGFRGYAGGLDAIVVTDDSERASTGPWAMPWFGGAGDETGFPSTAASTLAIYREVLARRGMDDGVERVAQKLACANWLLVEENDSSQRRAEVYKRKVAERGPRREGG